MLWNWLISISVTWNLPRKPVDFQNMAPNPKPLGYLCLFDPLSSQVPLVLIVHLFHLPFFPLRSSYFFKPLLSPYTPDFLTPLNLYPVMIQFINYLWFLSFGKCKIVRFFCLLVLLFKMLRVSCELFYVGVGFSVLCFILFMLLILNCYYSIY